MPAAGKDQDIKDQGDGGGVQTAKVPAQAMVTDLKSMCDFVAYCGVPLTTLQRALDSTSTATEAVAEVKQALLYLLDSQFDPRNVRALQLLLSSPFVQGSPADACAKFLDHFVAVKNWRMVLECLTLVHKWPFAGSVTPSLMCSCVGALTQASRSSPPHSLTWRGIKALTEWIVDTSLVLSTPDMLTALCRLWVVHMRSAFGSHKFGDRLMSRLQDTYSVSYAAALKNVDGLECAREDMHFGFVTPETEKALWDMAALLDDQEFHKFLDKPSGFARRLLQQQPLPASSTAALQRMVVLDRNAAQERSSKAEEQAKKAEERASKAEERVAAMAQKNAAMNENLRDVLGVMGSVS
jgi:hypothetical protein